VTSDASCKVLTPKTGRPSSSERTAPRIAGAIDAGSPAVRTISVGAGENIWVMGK
jgi:hypothetical protein